MPFYFLHYKVETCLNRANDLSLGFRGRTIVFRFHSRARGDRSVLAQVELEANNYRDAQEVASSVLLPPILDAFSFATGTPLLLGECELVLKDEAGSATRRAVYVGHKKTPTPVELTENALAETERILESAQGPRIALCWQRYALHRQLALDSFVFQWLALEALAGDADVTTPCPHCRQPVTHRGTNKARARELFIAANPEVSAQQFNRRIWGEARNNAFHGRSYPEPAFLAELYALTKQLQLGVDVQLRKDFGLTERKAAIHHYEQLYRVFLYPEWKTSNPGDRYATDCPLGALAEIASEHKFGAFVELADREFKLVNYGEFENW